MCIWIYNWIFCYWLVGRPKWRGIYYEEILGVDCPWPRTSLDFTGELETWMDLGPNGSVCCQSDPSKKMGLRGNPFSFKIVFNSRLSKVFAHYQKFAVSLLLSPWMIFVSLLIFSIVCEKKLSENHTYCVLNCIVACGSIRFP